MSTRCIALLGRKDEPTDAVEEYCRYLAAALRTHDIQLDIRRAPWEIHGWGDALHTLELIANQWRDTWVLVQYTALAWSARGFPQKVLRVLNILKSAGARVGIVFHDVEPYPGTRLIDVFRRFVQVRTMRQELALADLVVFTVPPERLSWLRVAPPHAAFIPVGPNVPIPPEFLAVSQQNPAAYDWCIQHHRWRIRHTRNTYHRRGRSLCRSEAWQVTPLCLRPSRRTS